MSMKLINIMLLTMLAVIMAGVQAGYAASDRSSAVKICKGRSTSLPKTGNSIVDTRCSLVAFEVCMYEETGVISQSQGSKKQCTIIKGLGGADACKLPCLAAAALPVGGNGKVDKYSGLTETSVKCYDSVVNTRIPGKKEENDDCNLNHALSCLINASSSPGVNAEILRDRKQGCFDFNSKYPGVVCSACYGKDVRVNYDPSIIDLDPKFCTPALAAAKQCIMPGTKVEKKQDLPGRHTGISAENRDDACNKAKAKSKSGSGVSAACTCAPNSNNVHICFTN